MGVKLGRSHWERNVGWGYLKIGCYAHRRRTTYGRRKVTGVMFFSIQKRTLNSNIGYFTKIKGNLITRKWKSVYNIKVNNSQGNVYTWYWWGNLRGRDQLGDKGVDGRIILIWIFRKWDVGVLNRQSWLRIGRGGGHLWMR